MLMEVFIFVLMMRTESVSMEEANASMFENSTGKITQSADFINSSAKLVRQSMGLKIKATTIDYFDESTTLNRFMVTNESLVTDELLPKVGVTQMILHSVFETIIALAICLGNSVVLLAVWRYKSLHSVTNVFIVSLSISDLCMGLVASPLSIIENYVAPLIYGYYVQNKLLCAFKLFSLAISGGGTLISLFGIAVDRYVAVLHPLKYHTIMTHFRVGVSLGIVWVIVFLSSVPVFSPNVMMFEPRDSCRSDEILDETYALSMRVIVGTFFILTSTLHIVVSVVALKHRKRIASELACFNNNLAVAYRKGNRITMTIFLVMAVFVVFWLPWTAFYSVKLKREPEWFTAMKYASVALYVSNSAVNPWIYAYRSKGMRKAMGNIIRCKWNRHINLE